MTGCGGRDLEIRATTCKGVQVLRLAGELDIATVGALHDAVLALDDPIELVLDLTALRFVDSSGVRKILQIDIGCRAAGGRLRLVQGPRAVQRVFSILGLTDRLEFIDRGARE